MTLFSSSEIWRACSALLDYVEISSGTQPMTPRTLLRHLDAIALGRHDIGDADDESLNEDDDPAYEKATYAWVAELGPFLSFHNSWWPDTSCVWVRQMGRRHVSCQ